MALASHKPSQIPIPGRDKHESPFSSPSPCTQDQPRFPWEQVRNGEKETVRKGHEIDAHHWEPLEGPTWPVIVAKETDKPQIPYPGYYFLGSGARSAAARLSRSTRSRKKQGGIKLASSGRIACRRRA